MWAALFQGRGACGVPLQLRHWQCRADRFKPCREGCFYNLLFFNKTFPSLFLCVIGEMTCCSERFRHLKENCKKNQERLTHSGIQGRTKHLSPNQLLQILSSANIPRSWLATPLLSLLFPGVTTTNSADVPHADLQLSYYFNPRTTTYCPVLDQQPPVLQWHADLLTSLSQLSSVIPQLISAGTPWSLLMTPQIHSTAPFIHLSPHSPPPLAHRDRNQQTWNMWATQLYQSQGLYSSVLHR